MTSETTTKLKYAGWGVAGGAVVAMVIGFTWGGWVTTGTAEEMSEEAVLANRAAICVAQFTNAPDYEERLQAFRETSSWKRSQLVQDGGWDRMPGQQEASSFVARACAKGITSILDE